MSRLPNVTAREVVVVLLKAGFEERNARSSHRRFTHPVTKRVTLVAMHPGDLERGLLKEILKQAGLTADEFLEFL